MRTSPHYGKLHPDNDYDERSFKAGVKAGIQSQIARERFEAEKLYKSAREVFDADNAATPQAVVDVIEWFVGSLRVAKEKS